MKFKNIFSKLAPTVLLLLIATSLITSSTFAWLSMNVETSVTGMKVDVETSDNLLIAPDTGNSDRAAESAFVNGQTSVIKGFIEPVSTVDALKFYYTSSLNVDAGGDAIAEKYIPYERYSSEAVYGKRLSEDELYANLFSENYDVRKSAALALTGTSDSAVGYIDYVFQIKATNASNVDEYVVLTQLDLTCIGLSKDCNAYRVAIFVQDITDSPAVGAMEENLTGIYKERFARNFDATPKAVNSESTLGNVTYVSSAAPLATVAPRSVAYYKVIARLWLEGEDDSCKVDTYLALDYRWGLELELSLAPDLSECVYELKDVSVINAALYAIGETGVGATFGGTAVTLYPVSGLTLDGAQVYTKSSSGRLTIDAELYTVSSAIATNVNEFFRLR